MLSKIRFLHLIGATWFALLSLGVCPRTVLSADSDGVPKKWKSMAELLYGDPRWKGWESHSSWHEHYLHSVRAKEIGLDSVAFDVWKSLVEHEGADRPFFDYYDQAFKITWDAGLLVGVTLSSHMAGPNVADPVRIGMSERLRNRIAGTVKLRQIFLRFPPDATPDAQELIRAEMRKIAAQATPENFSELAKQYSQDDFRAQGGDMGWLKRGTLEPARDDALNRLRVRQISKPVETDRGVYLLQLDEVEKNQPDLAFVSETGARNSHYSIWGLPYVEDILVDHWTTFYKHYASRASGFSEIIPGGTSAGEIRTTAWDEHDRLLGFKLEADYPGRGLLQISSILAKDDLRKAMMEKYGSDIQALNQAWRRGNNGFASWDAFSALTTKEEVDAFLAAKGEFSQMGKDVFGWLNDSLAKYAKRLLELAIKVFHAPGSPFAKVPLAIKFPVAHWHSHNRFPQLASGLIAPGELNEAGYPAQWNEADGHGYEWIFTKVLQPLGEEYPNSKNLIYPIFTGAEKPDCDPHCIHGQSEENCQKCLHGGRPGRSMARSLARGFVNLATRHRQPIAFENALNGGLYTDEGNRLIEELMASPWVRSITYLRQKDVVSPYNHFTAGSIARMRLQHEKNLMQIPAAVQGCPSQLIQISQPSPK